MYMTFKYVTTKENMPMVLEEQDGMPGKGWGGEKKGKNDKF